MLSTSLLSSLSGGSLLMQCLRTAPAAASVLSKAVSARFLNTSRPAGQEDASQDADLAKSTNYVPKDTVLPKQTPPKMDGHADPFKNTNSEVSVYEPSHDEGPDALSPKDQTLIQFYCAGANHFWSMLPELAKVAYDRGASEQEMWATVRHLIVFAGYAPTLATTITMRQAGMLRGQCPGKVGGPPGNAFELVYDKVTDVVRGKLHHWDPVLAEYIRLHLYGDVYSNPGLTMMQKQMLTVAFLSEANMHDQLYTHAIAAMRFGASLTACRQAVKIAFHMSPRPAVILRPILRSAFTNLDNAHKKFAKDYPNGAPPCPEVIIPDPRDVKIPLPPAPLFNKKPPAKPAKPE